jgi:(2Fe-2S) ferredoxin
LPGIEAGGIAVVLVARSAIAAAPRAEMERLAGQVSGLHEIALATYAFTEQGQPALREVVANLRRRPFREIRLVPLLFPMEASFRAWIGRTLARWQLEWDTEGPAIRIGPGPNASERLTDLVSDLVETAGREKPFMPAEHPATTGSVVAAAHRRVLVCQGGPCNEAGAAAIWGHLRNEQEGQSLRTAGSGMMSATTSCLGPCSLAPVVQVWPEGTVYGGVNEAGIDAIIREHLLGDRPVESLAYPANGRKQALRLRE